MKPLVTRSATGSIAVSDELLAHWDKPEEPMPPAPTDADEAVAKARDDVRRAQEALVLAEARQLEAHAAHREVSARVLSERLRTIRVDSGAEFTTRRTPYVPAADGRMGRWYILAGFEGRLLAIWEVTEYRKRFAGQIYGGTVPTVVSLAIQREYNLETTERGG